MSLWNWDDWSNWGNWSNWSNATLGLTVPLTPVIDDTAPFDPTLGAQPGYNASAATTNHITQIAFTLVDGDDGDEFFFDLTGTGLTLVGDQIMSGETVIATVSGGMDGSPLVITTSVAPIGAAQAAYLSTLATAVGSVRYVSDQPEADESRTINITTTRNNGTTDVQNITIDAEVSVTDPAFSWPEDLAASVADAQSLASGSSQPAVVATADGGYVVVWTAVASSETEVFAQRMGADGEPIGDPVLVTTAAGSATVLPSVAGLEGGGLVVVWRDYDSSTGIYSYSAQRIDAEGTAAGGVIPLGASDGHAQSIAIGLPGGGFALFWQVRNTTDFTADLMRQFFDGDGIALGSAALVGSTTGWSEQNPSATVLASGDLLLTWYDGSNDPQAQLFSGDGAALGAQFVLTIPGGVEQQPEVAALTDGGFAVTWFQNDGNGWGVWQQRFTSSGLPIGSSELVNETTASTQYEPSITGLSDGGWLIMWQGINPSTGNYDIYARRYDSNGNPEGGEFLVSSAAGHQFTDHLSPIVTELSDGGIAFVWRDGSLGVQTQVYEFGTPSISGAEDSAVGVPIYVDHPDTDGSETLSITITGFPEGTTFSLGSLQIDGSWLIAGTDSAALEGLTLTAPPEWIGEFQLEISSHNVEAANGDTASDSIVYDVSITANNDAPSGTDKTIGVSEDDAYTFAAADFGFVDNGGEANLLAGVEITTLPADGTLLLDGVAVIAGDEISAADIAAGKLTFQPGADEYGTGYASFTFQVRDDGGTANGGQDTDQTPNTITIDVAPDNTAPELDLNGAADGSGSSAAYTENAAGVTLAPDLILSDAEQANLAGATVSIGDGLALGDYLTVNGATNGTLNGISFSYDGSAGVLTLSGSASLADYQAVLRQVGFESTSDAPGTSRTISWTVNDGSVNSQVATTAVTVTSINDAPVNNVPAALQTFDEDGTVTFNAANGNAISVGDGDSGSGTLTVTLSVQSGALTLSATSNLTVTGDGTNGVTLSGTAENINAALDGLVYNPGADYNGDRTITVTTNDQGNVGDDPGLSGDGTSEQDSDSILVDVIAVNDAPVVFGDGTVAAADIAEDSPGSGETVSSLFSAQYSDAADAQFGVGNPGGSSQGSFSGVAVVANGSSEAVGQWQYYDSATSQWVDVGSVSSSSALLIGSATLVRFDPAADFEGAAPTLTVHLIDNSLGYGISHGQVVDISEVGATGGSTPFSAGTVVLSQAITAANDAPVNAVPGAQAGTEDVDLVLAGDDAISVADADDTTLTVTLSASNGVLTLTGTTGLTFTTGDGSADGSMTFSGTAADINAALDGLVYRGNLNHDGADTIAVSTSDGTAPVAESSIAVTLADDSWTDGESGSDEVSGTDGNDRFDLSQGGDDDASGGTGRDVFYYGGALTGNDSNDGGDAGGDPRGDLLVIQGNYTITLGAETLVDIEKFRVLRGTNDQFGYEGGGTFTYNITTVDANVAAGTQLVVQGGSLQVGETLVFDGSAETDGSFKLFGGRDDDILTGGAGDDHILGRAGDDVINGKGGADRIRGGLGGDALDGGEGADVFVYAPLPNEPEAPYTVAALESTSLDYDTITGFTFGEDRIDLPQAVTSLGQLLSGSLSDATFDADLAAAVDGTLEANGALLFTADAGDQTGETFLIVDGDGNGSYDANLDYVVHLEAPVGTVPTNAADLFV